MQTRYYPVYVTMAFLIFSCGPNRNADPSAQNPAAMKDTVNVFTVTSKDGTSIAYWKSGAGPPLLLVHGTTADHQRWSAITPRLEQHFTVYAMDRRGRGKSGDAPHYSILREAEDVAAVLEDIGKPTFLLGHSYGAVCVLEAALVTDKVSRLIIYEPPIPAGLPLYPPGVPDRMQMHIDRNEMEAALEIFIREVVKMPQSEFDKYRQSPMWKVRVSLTPTIPRELAIDRAYSFGPERFAGLRIPTLLLLGGESSTPFQRATEMVHSALPNSKVSVMAGQRHIAMDSNPELFLKEVLEFLGE